MTTNAPLPPLRIIDVCAVVIGILLFGIVLFGVIVEAPEMWREGASSFFADAFRRLGFGALLAILSAMPYILMRIAARRLGPPRLFSTASALLLLFQLALTIKMVFFANSSTESIGLVFLPVYVLAVVVVIWAVAWLAHRIRQSQ